MKILFICKKNETYGFSSYTKKSSGLFNSTNFIVTALNATCRNVEAKIVEVVDGNCLDREIFQFKPDKVVVEALWVTPEKFTELQKLHPKVKFYVHLHSNIPFLANEGMAIGWIDYYTRQGIAILANSQDSYEAFRAVLPHDMVKYLPNIYTDDFCEAVDRDNREVMHIGCFGAIRPMKNQLTQAMAAIRFAHKIKRPLKFYINSSRIETGGDPVLKNLRNIFVNHPNCELVECEWFEPDAFVKFMNERLDIGMQVSMSETFNIVAADYVAAGLPIVVSDEITWASDFNKVGFDSVNNIVDKLEFVNNRRMLVKWNQRLLRQHSAKARELWCQFSHS